MKRSKFESGNHTMELSFVDCVVDDDGAETEHTDPDELGVLSRSPRASQAMYSLAEANTLRDLPLLPRSSVAPAPMPVHQGRLPLPPSSLDATLSDFDVLNGDDDPLEGDTSQLDDAIASMGFVPSRLMPVEEHTLPGTPRALQQSRAVTTSYQASGSVATERRPSTWMWVGGVVAIAAGSAIAALFG